MASTAFQVSLPGCAKRPARTSAATTHARAGRSALLRLALVALAVLTLSGCMLISGEATTIDLQAGGGNLLTTFVGAEGREARRLEVGQPGVPVQVIVILSVESGDLELALVEPDGAVAFAVAARPDAQVTRSGSVQTDDTGAISYTVNARSARQGSYQIFVQP